MYSSSRNNRSYGQNKPRGRFQGRGSFGGGRRQPKKLDANLFIKKATPIVAVTDDNGNNDAERAKLFFKPTSRYAKNIKGDDGNE